MYRPNITLRYLFCCILMVLPLRFPVVYIQPQTHKHTVTLLPLVVKNACRTVTQKKKMERTYFISNAATCSNTQVITTQCTLPPMRLFFGIANDEKESVAQTSVTVFFLG